MKLRVIFSISFLKIFFSIISLSASWAERGAVLGVGVRVGLGLEEVGVSAMKDNNYGS